MHFKLNRLDTGKIKPHAIHLFQAKRGGGKTTLLRQILYDIRNSIDVTIAFAPCQSSQDMFRSLIPAELVYAEFRVDVIEKLLSLQRELLAQNKQRNICIVLDDCSYRKDFWRSPAMASLVRNGRHSLVTLLITSQAACDIPPDVRGNVDYIYALKTGILADRRRLHNFFFGMLPFDSFVRVFEGATDNFGALCCNQAEASNDAQKVLSWTRAALRLPPFHMCRPCYFKIAEGQREQAARDTGSQLAISVITHR